MPNPTPTNTYDGYLVAISRDGVWYDDDDNFIGIVIPEQFIRYNTFKATYQPIDINSGESLASGRLYRKVLKRRKLKVEWNVPSCTNTELQTFLDYFRNNWYNEKYCSIYVRAYIPSLGVYKSDRCYLTSDLNFAIISKTPYGDSIKEILYDETRIALIGYTTASANYKIQ